MWRVRRARIAIILHKTPAEVDEMDAVDANDVLQVYMADNTYDTD
jgi:hypothetical protein